MFVMYSDRIPFDFVYDLCYVYYCEHCQEHIHFVYLQHQTDLRKPNCCVYKLLIIRREMDLKKSITNLSNGFN